MMRAAFLLTIMAATAEPCTAQVLSGRFSIAGESGYSTNTYLEPGLSSWDTTAVGPFYAISPTAYVDASGSLGYLAVSGGYRHQASLAGQLPARGVAYLQALGQRSIHPSWRIGFGAMATTALSEEQVHLVGGGPFVTWNPSARSALTGRTGMYRYGSRSEGGEASLLYSQIELSFWPQDGWQIGAGLYGSHGYAGISMLPDGYGANGGAVSVRHTTNHSMNLTLSAGLERMGYIIPGSEAGASGPPAGRGRRPIFSVPTAEPEDDRYAETFLRGGFSIEWPLPANIVVLTQIDALYLPGLPAGVVDFYASAGLRASLPAFRRQAGTRGQELWTSTPDGERLQIRYAGEGDLFLTGDFNNWELPGIRLTEEPGQVHSTVLPLPAGSYQYKVRVIRHDEQEWLLLPTNASTAPDGFGGENGVLIVDY